MGLARLGGSLSALLLSIVTNGGVIASSRYVCTIGAKKKGVKFFLTFFFVGCGRVGVGAWVWARGSVGGGGGMEMGGHGMRRAGLGLSLSDGRESPPWTYPTRIRIAGSCVMDRPTFRLPGSQMRACLGWEKPHTRPVGGKR